MLVLRKQFDLEKKEEKEYFAVKVMGSERIPSYDRGGDALQRLTHPSASQQQ